MFCPAALIFAVILATHLTNVHSACDQASLEALPSMPGFLYVPEFELVDAKVKLRCTDGRVLQNYVDGGYFEVTCENETWVEPTTWPTEDQCASGEDCLVVVLQVPSYLSATPANNVSSGEWVTVTCADQKKILRPSWPDQPLQRECYDGTFLASESDSWPLLEDCIDDIPCDGKLLDTLGAPSHIVPNLNHYSSQIQNGGHALMQCKDNQLLEERFDPDRNGGIEVLCEGGSFKAPSSWPTMDQCKAVCTFISLPSGAGFTPPTLPLSVMEGEELTLSCTDPNHYINLNWTEQAIKVKCNTDSQFIEPNPWPYCTTRPLCGTPPDPPIDSGLEIMDPAATPAVSEVVKYSCQNASLITTMGDIVELTCNQDDQESDPDYILPPQWGNIGMTCREKIKCTELPILPDNAGLVAENFPSPNGTFEFDKVNFTCSNADHVMYMNHDRYGQEFFELTCVPPGEFEIIPPEDWPYCDVADRPTCTDYPNVNEGVPISLVSNEPVFPGQTAVYKCDDPTMMTNLGETVEVKCEKDWDTNTVSFVKPPGWTNMKCIPSSYPHFEQEPCICLGHPAIDRNKAKEILDTICRKDIRVFGDKKIVPMKKRCGVTDLNAVKEENKCYCSEEIGNGVDFGVWSIVEVSTFPWHRNLTESGTIEFILTQNELEIELDRIILGNNPNNQTWRFVRSYVFGFIPGKPKQCSQYEIPEPPFDTGLVIKERKSVSFGEDIEFVCKSAGYITDAGETFKVKCLETGKFQNKVWRTCRERKICVKAPPRPPDTSGLAQSTSSYVHENDFAVYECQNSDYIVPSTSDGKFRTPCKRTGNFEQSIRIDWPTCIPKPTPWCQPIPDAPTGYVRVPDESFYVKVGEKVTYACEDSDLLIGNAESISFECAINADGSTYLRGLESSIPSCRPKRVCSQFSVPSPPEETGLERPFHSQVIMETEYVEYRCNEWDSWSLLGYYKQPDEFDADNAAIEQGRLRLFCMSDGSFGTVRKWPKCRDSKITECKASEMPDLQAFQLEIVPQTDIPVMESATIRCINPDYVTDHFKELDLTCNYNGKFMAPNVTFTQCRDKKVCGESPSAPVDTKLVMSSVANTLYEFDIQPYECVENYTLLGINHDMISETGVFELPCTLDSSGAFVQPSSWPTCNPVQSECLNIPSLEGFVTSSVPPVDVGLSVEYFCEDQSQVTDLGFSFKLECTESGSFTTVDPLPECRAPSTCVEPPIPPSSSRLLNSSSVDVMEFQEAVYSCQTGTRIREGVNSVSLTCGLGGLYPTNFAWPQCEFYQCQHVNNSVPSFTTVNAVTGPVDVGTIVQYKCQIDSQIAGDSPDPINAPCNPNTGLLDYPQTWPECRSKLQCEANPVPPDGTFLDPSTSNLLREFDYAEYSCQSGANFHGVVNDNIVNGKFLVQCGLQGKFPTTIDWPTCNVYECTNIPNDNANFEPNTTNPIPVGWSVKYTCLGIDFVMDSPNNELLVECMPDGNIVFPSNPPTCRAASSCTSPPEPNATANLNSTQSTSVLEYDYAIYECNDGASYDGVIADGVYNGVFHVLCQAVSVTFETVTTWPQCLYKFCTTMPSFEEFSTTDTVPVPVGGYLTFSCSNTSLVTDQGATVKSMCLHESGQFETIIATCREPSVCSNSPPIPQNSNLLSSAQTNVNEFDYALYACPSGTFLTENEPNVFDGQFGVQCEGADTFESVVNWPTCKQHKCDTIPEDSGWTLHTTAPVYVGASAAYTCINSGEVFSSGSILYRECLDDGTFGWPNGLSTWPTCRTALQCEAPPTPPAESNFKPYSAATVVKEFQAAVFDCMDGMVTDFGDSAFELTCNEGGTFTEPNQWPVCRVPTCTTNPGTEIEPKGVQVEAGKTINFVCSDSNKVTDLGKKVPATCGFDGLMAPDGTSLQCREPVMCSNSPPNPPPSSNLVLEQSLVVSLEFEEAIYECKAGFTLLGTAEAEGRIDIDEQGRFLLPCGLGGEFNHSFSDWPICQAVCTEHLTPPTLNVEDLLEPLDTSPNVVAGDETLFKCSSAAYILDTGLKTFPVTCGPNGQFIEPSIWPSCRTAVTCPFPPTPPPGSNWVLQTAQPIQEQDHAVYKCADGYAYTETEPVPEGIDVTQGTYNLKCMANGYFESFLYWATDGWPICQTTSTTRRKRFTDYDLHDDIEYSILAFFETQFMFTDGIKQEIEARTGLSVENYGNFSREMVLTLHDKLNNKIIPKDKILKPRLKFGQPVQPLCDQPTGADMTGFCVPSYNPATCSKSILQGAWIKSLGYTYTQQSPKWTDPAMVQYNTPIGSEIYFYCSDPLKRPRKDEWDADSEDGIISTYCSHGGVFSITMNPAEWDRCRMKCPAGKPVPPVYAGLERYDSFHKWERQLWEDEYISYGCQNKTLVIDEIKDKMSVSYVCLPSGEYNTPDFKSWPRCTQKPIDPLIVDAIHLLTSKFDRNLEYRQLLAKGDGSDVKFMETTEGIISITVPIVACILIVIFLVMCCTRANSPICKIFEPQA